MYNPPGSSLDGIDFSPETNRVAMYVEIGECRFPASGGYRFEVWFEVEDSLEVQKGEEKLEIHSSESES